MHPKYKGYAYVLCMLDVICATPNIMHELTADLYPAVMARFGVSRAAVERGVRFVIEKTWEQGNAVELLRIFGAYKTGWVPTNGEFIAVLSEYMLCERLCRAKAKHG